MNEMAGVILRLDGGYAWVRAAGPGPACGACSQQQGCGSVGVLDDALGQGRKPQLLRLSNTIGARPGDTVTIRAADGMVFKAAWRAYGIPLLLGLLGALLAASMSGEDWAALTGLLAGLVSGVLWVRHLGLEAGRAEPILSMSFEASSVISFKDH